VDSLEAEDSDPIRIGPSLSPFRLWSDLVFDFLLNRTLPIISLVIHDCFFSLFPLLGGCAVHIGWRVHLSFSLHLSTIPPKTPVDGHCHRFAGRAPPGVSFLSLSDGRASYYTIPLLPLLGFFGNLPTHVIVKPSLLFVPDPFFVLSHLAGGGVCSVLLFPSVAGKTEPHKLHLTFHHLDSPSTPCSNPSSRYISPLFFSSGR